ncbi:MAG: FtsX-like permease family protein [Bacteroidota bacterium]
MSIELRIALRLFFRFNPNSPKRFSFLTIASIVGIMLGVMSLVLAQGLISGFEKELKTKMLSFSSHIQISSFSKNDNLEVLSEKIKNEIDGIEDVSEVYTKEGMLSVGDEIEGAILTSYENEIFKKRLSKYFKGDCDLKNNSNDFPKIILGERLKESLKINYGDTIIYSTFINENEPIVFTAILSGSINSGFKEYDENFAFINIDFSKLLFGNLITTSHIELDCKNISEIENKVDEINKKYKYKYLVSSVYDLNKNIFSWIELQKKPTPIFMSLLLIVAMVNIISTLLTSIVEKRYTIGVLQTIGVNKNQIHKIFLYKGLIIVTIGIMLGVFLAFGFTILQENYKIIKLPSEIYFMDAAVIDSKLTDYIFVIVGTYLISFLALYIPSKKAIKISPLEAIKIS